MRLDNFHQPADLSRIGLSSLSTTTAGERALLFPPRSEQVGYTKVSITYDLCSIVAAKCSTAFRTAVDPFLFCFLG